MPEIDDVSGTQSTEEQQSNELSEEFEQRRWTKRTQQVLRVLDRNLSNKDSVNFSSLTQSVLGSKQLLGSTRVYS